MLSIEGDGQGPSTERLDRDGAGFPGGLLDRIVHRAHRVRWAGYPAHPYFLMADLAVAGVVALGLGFGAAVDGFSLWGFAVAYLITQLAYQVVYLRLKERLIGERARSFLQDTLLVVLPTWMAASWLVGLPPAVAADFAALSLSLVLGFMRLGCFVGGCCFGVPARWGVFYPRRLLRSAHTWRRFTPGPYPGERVVPIQLISSAVSFALFGLLTLRMVALGEPDGRALPWYFVGYGLYRFVAEFFRGHRHRPMKGALSEAQRVCVVVVAAAGLILAVWR